MWLCPARPTKCSLATIGVLTQHKADCYGPLRAEMPTTRQTVCMSLRNQKSVVHSQSLPLALLLTAYNRLLLSYHLFFILTFSSLQLTISLAWPKHLSTNYHCEQSFGIVANSDPHHGYHQLDIEHDKVNLLNHLCHQKRAPSCAKGRRKLAPIRSPT